MNTIKYVQIRTFSIRYSQEIINQTFKQNYLILVKFLIENKIEQPSEFFNQIHLLFTDINNENFEDEIKI